MSDVTGTVYNSIHYAENAAINVIELLNTLLKVTVDDEQRKKIEGLINNFEQNNENARMLTIKKEVRQDIYMALKENGINAVFYSNLDDPEKDLLVFSKNDEPKIKMCINEIMERKGYVHEVSLSELKDTNYKKSLTSIKGLNQYQIESLRYNLNKQPLQYAVEKTNNGKYEIIIPSARKPMFDKILLKTSLALSGERGAIEKRLIDERLQNQKLIQNALEKGESFWVADVFNTNTRQMEKTYISNQEYIHYQGNNVISDRCSVNDPSYREKLELLLDKKKDLVFISKEEYDPNPRKLKELVKKKSKHKHIKETLKEIDEKEKKARELIEAKLARTDIDEQKKILNGLYNDTITLNSFLELDKLNKEKNEEILDFFEKIQEKHELKVELLDRIEGSIHDIETLEITDYYVETLSIEGLVEQGRQEILSEQIGKTERGHNTMPRIGLPERI